MAPVPSILLYFPSQVYVPAELRVKLARERTLLYLPVSVDVVISDNI